jgi:cell division protein FtsB
MRLLIVVLAGVLVSFQVRLWISDDGMREVWRLRTEVERQTEDNRRLAERNAALEAEVQDLKDGLAAAEERARAELGMIHSEETFYQIIPSPEQAPNVAAGGAAR